jgi:hypothetical protein
MVVAYTDGVSEARRNRQIFGEDRILELVDRFSDHGVDEVLEHLVDAVLEFGGRPNRDDIAAIAIRRSAKRDSPSIDGERSSELMQHVRRSREQYDGSFERSNT